MFKTQTCPFCVEPISSTTKHCPHCGQLVDTPIHLPVLDDEIDTEQTVVYENVDDFMAAYLRGAELSGAYLSGADLFSASLASADLRGADLGEANLCNADLSRADLRGANLLGADLSDARLGGADLRETNLMATDLSGAVYDDLTLWPDGFDPRSAGAIHASEGK